MLEVLCTINYRFVGDSESIYRFGLEKDNGKYVIKGCDQGECADIKLQGKGDIPIGMAMDAFYLNVVDFSNNAFEYILDCDARTALATTRELRRVHCMCKSVKRVILNNFRDISY